MNEKLKNISIIVLILILAFPAKNIFAKDKRVLFISSYHPSFPTFYNQIDGIKSVFDSSNIILDVEFMDSKRFTDEENTRRFINELCYKLLHSEEYDAIITSDDNALNFVTKYQDSLFSNIPIVFSGVNNIDKALKQNNNPWITGVVEAVSMEETIALILDLYPNTDSIIALVDQTPSGQGDLKTFYQNESKFSTIRFSHINLSQLSFHEFKSQLNALPKATPVILLSAYKDKLGNTINFKESLEIITQNLKSPLFHLWHHGLGNGILGGKLISHFHQSKEAALIVENILNGKNINSIKVIEKSPNVFYFDYNEMMRFNIDKSQIPENSIIINIPQSFYSRNRNLILTTIIIFISLILFIIILLYSNIKRKQAEVRLKELNTEYHHQNIQLQDAISMAETNELMFKHLFENNPISLWEEDFSELRRILAEESKKHQIEELIENNPEFIAKCASSIKIKRINQATLNLFKFDTKEEIINNLNHTFNDVSFNTFKKLMISLAKGNKKFTEETEYIKKDKSKITAILHVLSFSENENSIVAIVDTTQLKLAERELIKQNLELMTSELELKKLNAELIQAKNKAEESDQLKSAFLANMSHEIRTPMNGILGFIEVLQEPDIEQQEREQYSQIISKSGHRLLNTINDILEISRIDTGDIPIQKQNLNITQIISDHHQFFLKEAEEKGLILHLDIDNKTNGVTIKSDKTKIDSILTNLIKNAIKFTEIGAITINCSQKDEMLQISIKDTGCGISVEKQKLIFDRFRQADSTLSRNKEGSGLGLAISKAYVEKLGGKIWLESTEQKGSTFYFTLPTKTI